MTFRPVLLDVLKCRLEFSCLDQSLAFAEKRCQAFILVVIAFAIFCRNSLDPFLDAIKGESCPLATVEVIAVNVEDSVAISGRGRSHDRLLQPCTDDNNLKRKSFLLQEASVTRVNPLKNFIVNLFTFCKIENFRRFTIFPSVLE